MCSALLCIWIGKNSKCLTKKYQYAKNVVCIIKAKTTDFSTSTICPTEVLLISFCCGYAALPLKGHSDAREGKKSPCSHLQPSWVMPTISNLLEVWGTYNGRCMQALG